MGTNGYVTFLLIGTLLVLIDGQILYTGVGWDTGRRCINLTPPAL